MATTVHCPRCDSPDVVTHSEVVDRNTGLKPESMGWIVLGAVMGLVGLFLVVAAFMNRGNPSPGVPGFWKTLIMGLLLMTWGAPFIHRRRPDRVNLLRYACRQCGTRWRVLDDEEAGVGAGPLLQAVASTDAEVRRRAASALGNIGYSSFAEPLAGLLSDPVPAVRAAAAAALGKLRNPASVPPLLTLLSDADDDVRVNAAKGLASVGEPEVVAPLVDAIANANWSRAGDFATALGSIRNPKAEAALEEAAQHANVAVVTAARKALKGMTRVHAGTG